jgi:endonuclease/exonuclease/phosphatase family metal-dependent hydrolase
MAVSRISVMTFNMCKTDGYPINWPHRRLPIIECMTAFTPDILCIQELHPLLHDTIVEALPTHAFVQDDFPGWQSEGNIYWNSDMFKMLEYGMVDIGIMEPLRRLFWVRLGIKIATNENEEQSQSNTRQLLVTTAHYTWQGHIEERTTDINLRKQQTRRTVTALQDLTAKFDNPHLAVLFMGDLNENYHPRRILREAGFVDCFAELRLPTPTTHPQRPSEPKEDIQVGTTLDWIMQNQYARPILASALQNLFCTGGYSVSDHCPVMCVYEIGAGPYKSNAVQDFSGKNIVKWS